MQWIKIYAGMATDPKFRLIAKDTGTHVGDALGVWLMILEEAGKADGDAYRFNPRLADMALNLKDGKTQAIIEAMQGLGMLDEMYVTAWERRQSSERTAGSNADAQARNSTERSREYRARQKSQNKKIMQRHATLTQRHATLLKKRIE